MSRLAHHYATLAYNNAWANHRLLGAVARLADEEFGAERTGFFPSLRATLNHVVTVDWLYTDAIERSLRGEPPNPEPGRFFRPEVPFETATELRVAQRAVDARLVDVCRSLKGPELDQPVLMLRRAGVTAEPLTRLLAHLFQHQIHHRGQAHAMLAGTSVAPPQLDEFFCANEAHLRRADLADLGYFEEMIWPPAARD